ncbi:MAG: hypothetical protein ACXVCP_02450 [Bdellovibrio sp.]
MKTYFFIGILALGLGSQTLASNNMPTLHKIETYTFQASYSCNGSYEKSALFMSDFSKQRNSPDLLFDGTCGSQLYIEATTAGDDYSVISDLGNVPLESVSASKSFNYDRTVGHDNTFKETMPVVAGHTYAVLISKSDIRALYVLKVDTITNGQMKIRYAVKSYSIQASQVEVPGFNWDQGNQ